MVPFKKTTIFVGVDNLREEIVKNFLKNKRVIFAYNALFLTIDDKDYYDRINKVDE